MVSGTEKILQLDNFFLLFSLPKYSCLVFSLIFLGLRVAQDGRSFL